MESSKEDKGGNINDVLTKVGVPGHYHLNNFFWAFVIGVVIGFHTVAIPFIQGDLNYR